MGETGVFPSQQAQNKFNREDWARSTPEEKQEIEQGYQRRDFANLQKDRAERERLQQIRLEKIKARGANPDSDTQSSTTSEEVENDE